MNADKGIKAEILFDQEGSPYFFTEENEQHYIDEFQEGSPYFFAEENEQHYIDEFCKDVFNQENNKAYLPLSNFASMVIEIDDMGDNVFYKYVCLE